MFPSQALCQTCAHSPAKPDEPRSRTRIEFYECSFSRSPLQSPPANPLANLITQSSRRGTLEQPFYVSPVATTFRVPTFEEDGYPIMTALNTFTVISSEDLQLLFYAFLAPGASLLVPDGTAHQKVVMSFNAIIDGATYVPVSNYIRVRSAQAEDLEMDDEVRQLVVEDFKAALGDRVELPRTSIGPKGEIPQEWERGYYSPSRKTAFLLEAMQAVGEAKVNEIVDKGFGFFGRVNIATNPEYIARATNLARSQVVVAISSLVFPKSAQVKARELKAIPCCATSARGSAEQ
ncbi:hypothetical protein M427DRAFT_59803 [Gonapodya prolifera JEL478]|uniref:Uncharacterized protein n=1 Tax=Gonapodya prolifera (strain JEL478) TaxID=1344416 RepID=A0A139A5Q5_GONPJ|nr:hypothetical protein M427DRAFT_59803 [Gonapodya prolifera JEL478]|eukprot:KXS12116.1 hypothetical protein M427DRAFT_59803 [Gonapodya prolifera JEL478]